MNHPYSSQSYHPGHETNTTGTGASGAYENTYQKNEGDIYETGVDPSGQTSGYYEVSCVEAGGANGRSDPVRSLAFDPIKELVWVGTGSGMLHSHYAEDMTRIVSSYIADPSPDRTITDDVRDLAVSESSVLAAMGYGLAVVSRGGVLKSSVRADTLKDAKGLALSPLSDAHVCMGGESRMLAVVDLQQQRILRQATLRGATSVTRALWAAPDGASSVAIFSTATGRISFCDPSSMREINAVAAFTGATTAIASSGYYLAATGLGTRGGVPYMEQHVKIFDIRSLESPLPSVMFQAPPLFITFDSLTSEMYNTNEAMWILSPNGLLQCMDISAIASGTPAYPLTDPIQLDAGADVFTSMAVSPRGLLALGDAGGFVHEWSCSAEVKVNADSESIWSAPITTEPPTPSVQLDGLLTADIGVTIPKCVLPEFGHSYLTDELFAASEEFANWRDPRQPSRKLSNSTADTFFPRRPFARFPLCISDEIVNSAKSQSFVGYAQAPSSFVRNSEDGHKKVPVVRGMYGPRSDSAGNKSRLISKSNKGVGDLDLSRPFAKSFYVEMDLVAWESIEGFDFLKYNKSALFCGLENALPNVYVNAAVQVLYFTPPIRRAIANHECDRQWCISCELGFLFHMFDLGGAGMACEAGNFTRAFMTMANAGALGLLDGPHALPLSQRIENFTRYLLEQLHKDEASETSTMVSALFGAEMKSYGKFTPSETEWERISRPFQHTLMYEIRKGASEASFCEVVQYSLSHSLDPTRAFCEKSGQFETMSQKREVCSLPNVLLLGCNTKSGEYLDWWCGKGSEDGEKDNAELSEMKILEAAAERAIAGEKKLVESMRIELGTDDVYVSEIETGEDILFGYDQNEGRDGESEGGECFAEYDLSFVIVHVPPLHKDGERQSGGRPGSRNVGGHLVAYIRVPLEYRGKEEKEKDGKRKGDWWCYNDFVISACEGFDEVAGFDRKWKMPCLVGYVRRDVWKRVDSERIVKEVNVREVIGSENVNGAIGLEEDEEAPGKGSLLGLDCEFVMVGRDEAEIFGDGSREVVVPARLALARVSVIRGYGRLKGKALMDDYVEVGEPVIDYLTRFSGIEEGDLDAGRSRYRVSSVKRVYKRLRSLVDAGCIFVGHGLKSDFRMINFVVPIEQVKDTVTLFRVGKKRLLGLRFLSKALLGGDIQKETHDSIEDCLAAVGLYELYLKLEQKGADVLEYNLKELYDYGYSVGWKGEGEKGFEIEWEPFGKRDDDGR